MINISLKKRPPSVTLLQFNQHAFYEELGLSNFYSNLFSDYSRRCCKNNAKRYGMPGLAPLFW